MIVHKRLGRAWDRLAARTRVHLAKPSPHPPNLDEDVVISLTTYPARIATVHRTVISLLMQRHIAKIVLYLATDDFPQGTQNLPKRLTHLVESFPNLVLLRWVNQNTRSYKKLLPALAEYGERTFVTVDADVLYHATWLSRLLQASRDNPGVVIGTRGNEMISDASGHIRPYSSWPEAAANTPSFATFLTGRGGILYPSGSLAPPVADVGLALQLAPTADDVWFKAATIRAGFPSMRVPIRRDYPSSGASQEDGLFKVNVNNRANDAAIKAVFDHFRLTVPRDAYLESTDEN